MLPRSAFVATALALAAALCGCSQPAAGARALAAVAPATADFSQPGPCTTPQNTKFSLSVPLGLVSKLGATLPLTLNIPSCPAGARLPFGSPAPLLIFFSGFQGRASEYQSTVQAAARWGIPSLQYDTAAGFGSTPSAKTEVDLFPALVRVGEGGNRPA